MRIGVNTLFMIPGQVGGSETYLREVLRHCLGAPGVTWVLFTNLENDRYFRELCSGRKDVHFHPTRVRATNRVSRILFEQFSLPRAAQQTRLDLLWSPGYTAPLRAPCPQVVCVHDMQYREFPQDLTLTARLASHFLIPAAVRRCQGVVAISQFSKRQILQYVRVPALHVQVIYAGVDPAFGQATPAAQARATLARYLPEGPYVLCVANTYPHKNVHMLIDAFGRTLAGTPARLVLVGIAGQGEEAVQKALLRLPEPGQVTRLRGLSTQDLIVLYQNTACFVFPSLYEGFGLPVLEAMMAGVPVLAAAKASIPEIGGEAICYFDGTSASLEANLPRMLHLTPDQRQEMAEKERRAASRFDWRQTAADMLRYLTKMGVGRSTV